MKKSRFNEAQIIGVLREQEARLNPAAGRLRNLISSTGRPLPPALEINYQPPRLSQ